MAAPRPTALRAASRTLCARCAFRLRVNTTSAAARCSSSSTTAASTDSSPPPPALLSKLKSDLKSAMRAKDTPRLNVLRAIISETNQAASSAHPIRTDQQIVALLKKRKAASEAAAREAAEVNREDLRVKQEREIEVIDEYAGSVKMVGVDEVRAVVRKVVQELGAVKSGMVMKEVLKPGGPLDGKTVDRAQVAEVVREVLAANTNAAA